MTGETRSWQSGLIYVSEAKPKLPFHGSQLCVLVAQLCLSLWVVSVASHLFILGIINSETHSGSCYYSYGRMGSLRTPSYPHQLHSHQLHSTLSPGETQVLSTNPRVPSPLRVAASPAGPAHVFKSTPDDCSATSSQRDFPKIIYIFSLAAISSPLPTHFIRSHIAML